MNRKLKALPEVRFALPEHVPSSWSIPWRKRSEKRIRKAGDWWCKCFKWEQNIWCSKYSVLKRQDCTNLIVLLLFRNTKYITTGWNGICLVWMHCRRLTFCFEPLISSLKYCLFSTGKCIGVLVPSWNADFQRDWYIFKEKFHFKNLFSKKNLIFKIFSFSVNPAYLDPNDPNFVHTGDVAIDIPHDRRHGPHRHRRQGSDAPSYHSSGDEDDHRNRWFDEEEQERQLQLLQSLPSRRLGKSEMYIHCITMQFN